MKKVICVSIDVENYLIAKQKIPNLSAFCNQCLKDLVGTTNGEVQEQRLKEQLEKVNNSMQEMSIKKSIIEMELKQATEKAEEEKKTKQLEEQYKRWICPVDKHLNFMDQTRCTQCNLPTRNSKNVSYTVIKNEE